MHHVDACACRDPAIGTGLIVVTAKPAWIHAPAKRAGIREIPRIRTHTRHDLSCGIDVRSTPIGKREPLEGTAADMLSEHAHSTSLGISS